MGIPGLLKELGNTERVALAKLAVDHFEKHKRPLRIAIDAAIWNFQTQSGQGGKNPALRTFFFRLLRILALPIHPIFVYDGKNKPLTKRGKTVSRYGTCMPNELSKNLVARFQFPHHTAPGEAEAECAFLQQNGIVDAVMSQDVDALMFGSTLTLRDWSKEGTKGNKGPTHVNVYSSDKIREVCGIDSSGMILVALLSGGDYGDGVPKFGAALSCQTAKAGFGEELITIIKRDDEEGLKEWRQRLQYELETNESGYFLKRHMTIKIPEDFPDRTVLGYYLKPAVSDKQDLEKLEARWSRWWDKDIDIPALREYTAMTFDWLYKEGARNFVRHLAQPLFMHRLKRKQIEADNFSVSDITETRKHFVHDGLAELRVSVVPAKVVGIDIESEEDNPEFACIEVDYEPEVEDVGMREPSTEPAAAPSSPSKYKKRQPWDPDRPEKWWVLEMLLSTGMPVIVKQWQDEQFQIRADPLKFATRKCKVPAKAKGVKKIDRSMKDGALKDFLSVTSTSSTNAHARAKKPFQRAKTDTALLPLSQKLDVDVHFKPSRATKTFQFPTVGSRATQFDEVYDRSDNDSDNDSDVDLPDLLHKPSRTAPIWLNPSQDDQHFAAVASSPLITRRRNKIPSLQEELDDDIIYVGSKQIPLGAVGLGTHKDDQASMRVLHEHSAAPRTAPRPQNPGNRTQGICDSFEPRTLSPSRIRTRDQSITADENKMESASTSSSSRNHSRKAPLPSDNLQLAHKAVAKIARIRESLPGTWKEIPLTPSQDPGVKFVDLTNT